MPGMKYLGCALTLMALALDSGVRRRHQAAAAAGARGKRAAVRPGEGVGRYGPGPGSARGIRPRNHPLGVRPAVGRSRRHRADARSPGGDCPDLCGGARRPAPARRVRPLLHHALPALSARPAENVELGAARRRSERAAPRRRCSGSTAPRRARSFTPTAADTPVPPTDIWGGTPRPYLAGFADDGAAGSAHVDVALRGRPGRARSGAQRRPPHACRQAPARHLGHAA